MDHPLFERMKRFAGLEGIEASIIKRGSDAAICIESEEGTYHLKPTGLAQQLAVHNSEWEPVPPLPDIREWISDKLGVGTTKSGHLILLMV